MVSPLARVRPERAICSPKGGADLGIDATTRTLSWAMLVLTPIHGLKLKSKATLVPSSTLPSTPLLSARNYLKWNLNGRGRRRSVVARQLVLNGFGVQELRLQLTIRPRRLHQSQWSPPHPRSLWRSPHLFWRL